MDMQSVSEMLLLSLPLMKNKMRIKKTFFTTELEISVQEIRDSYEKIHPNTMFFDMLLKLLKKLTK